MTTRPFLPLTLLGVATACTFPLLDSQARKTAPTIRNPVAGAPIEPALAYSVDGRGTYRLASYSEDKACFHGTINLHPTIIRQLQFSLESIGDPSQKQPSAVIDRAAVRELGHHEKHESRKPQMATAGGGWADDPNRPAEIVKVDVTETEVCFDQPAVVFGSSPRYLILSAYTAGEDRKRHQAAWQVQ